MTGRFLTASVICRHYVDRLVQYSTGRNKAAAATAKSAYELKRQRYTWTSALTVCTDAAYYNHLKVIGHVSVATAAMLSNRGKLTRFWGPKVSVSEQHTRCILQASFHCLLAIFSLAIFSTCSLHFASFIPLYTCYLQIGRAHV